MEDPLKFAKILAEPINSAINPTSKKVGECLEKTFSGTLGWLIMPFYYSAAYREVLVKRIKKLQNCLVDVHEQDIVEQISPQIAGPVFESLKYIDEGSPFETLYLNLLAKAMNKETISQVHPSFAYKLQNISGDEALMLLYLKEQGEVKGTAKWELKAPRYKYKLLEGAFAFAENAFCYPQNTYMYAEHLDSLQLIEAGVVKDTVAVLKGNDGDIIQRICDEEYILRLSKLGEMFVQVCIPDNLDLEDFKVT